MKSWSISLAAIVGWSPLRLAWRSYRCGKRRRAEVATFELEADRHLLKLSHALLNGSYRHEPYQLLRIYDPKPRMIAVAGVRDRIVHTALYRALAPGFLQSAISDSYACMPGIGTHRALLRFREFQRQNPYLIHMDIRSFFPSVDHQILRSILYPKLRSNPVKQLLSHLLDSGKRLYARPEMRDFYNLAALLPNQRAQGLPIGNVTSQWWGNEYLNGLDHFVKRDLGIKNYLRYMDDMVIFGRKRSEILSQRDQICTWLKRERHLEVHRDRAQVQDCQNPHVFLGYKTSRAGFQPGRKMMGRFRRKLTRIVQGNPAKLRKVLTSWRGLFF